MGVTHFIAQRPQQIGTVGGTKEQQEEHFASKSVS